MLDVQPVEASRGSLAGSNLGMHSELTGRLDTAAFVVVALIVAAPHLAGLDTFTEESIELFYSQQQILDLVKHGVAPTVTGWLGPLLELQPGSSKLGGLSLLWNLLVWPLFSIFGVSTKAISAGSIASHIVAVLSIWFYLRTMYPRRLKSVYGLVVLASPWYQASIFSNSFLALSCAWSMLSLAAFLSATKSGKTSRFLCVGVLVGLNFFGFVATRVYSVVVLLLACFWTLKPGLDPGQRGKRIAALGMLVLGIIIPLSGNLGQPGRTARVVFYDQEMIAGSMYDIETDGRSRLEVASVNAVQFFKASSFRNHSGFYDFVLLLLLAVGFGTSLKHRLRGDMTLAIGAGVVCVAVVGFTNCWTPTRMAALALPGLMLAAAGLDTLARVPEWPRSKKLKGSAFAILLALTALGSAQSNATFWSLHNFPHPFFEVARTVASWDPPVRVVIATGDDAHDLRRSYLVSLALAEAGRLNASTSPFYSFGPTVNDIEKMCRAWPQDVVAIVHSWRGKEALPTGLGLELRGVFKGGYALYRVAQPSELSGTHPSLPEPSDGPRMSPREEAFLEYGRSISASHSTNKSP